MAVQRVRTKVAKRGRLRASLDVAAAMEALAWMKGGDQLALPGLAMRLVGVEPERPEGEGQAGKAGRPAGAANMLPDAFRRWITRHGSAVDGLSQDAAKPLAAIVAELVQAYLAVAGSLGHGLDVASLALTPSRLLDLVETAKQIQLQARRYAAPYQAAAAPVAVDVKHTSRVAIGLFAAPLDHGQPVGPTVADAESVLARLLTGDDATIEQYQGVSDAVPMEVERREVERMPGDDARREGTSASAAIT